MENMIVIQNGSRQQVYVPKTQNPRDFQEIPIVCAPPTEKMSMEIIMKQLKSMDMRMTQMSQKIISIESNFNWTT